MADDVRDEELLAPVPGAARDGVSGSARAGLFVTFEGGDGAGKTTQIALAQAWLEEQGHAVVTTREPGGTELGVAIRQLILHGDHVAPRAEALLYAADRAHHVETLVRPALERGDVVLQDRYIDSSIAYQGAGRALDAADIESISRWATTGLTPELTVLLDVDPADGRARRGGRGGEDRLEREADDFHARVREHFLALAARDGERYLVLDASLPREDIAAAVRTRLEQTLAARR
ncbi:dTMP kinase [Dermacoccus sp. Tok2021]|uniref:dTMP kinase n=1 Tax=Dermacoccus sp. Tok2021 TaxID=2826873 RepID=UPI001CA70798|nr:dTMP kinase [Dermacoccus sp. Tok2021]MBZ4497251.1 dTMP kinase [Dermacoccus sp. Tok2021]